MTALADNANGYVCLTFDFDGPSLWMQRGMTTPTPISRGEFGAVAVPGFCVCWPAGIPSTFFVPGHTMETYPDVCRMIVDAGCEVALHGYAHEFNPTLTPDRERWTMVKSFELADRLCGAAADGLPGAVGGVDRPDHRSAGRARPDVRLVADGPRLPALPVRLGDRFPDDRPAEWGDVTPVVELPWSWTLDDYVYLEFVTFRRMLMPGLRRPGDMFDNFTGDLEWMRSNVVHGVCTVVFHPQVIGRGHRLVALEHWLDDVSEMQLSSRSGSGRRRCVVRDVRSASSPEPRRPLSPGWAGLLSVPGASWKGAAWLSRSTSPTAAVGSTRYHKASKQMGFVDGEHPGQGILFHWVEATDGGFVVHDVWESEEQFDAFVEEHLAPMAVAVGMEEPEIEITAIEGYRRPV